MYINFISHLGVYGIIRKDASILLIAKSRGPYKGKLDLPGGRPEHGETPEQTLVREVKEETGVTVYACQFVGNYSVIVEYCDAEGVPQKMHHLGMIYNVVSYDDAALINIMATEDSLGAQWYRVAGLQEDMLSPFALRVVQELR